MFEQWRCWPIVLLCFLVLHSSKSASTYEQTCTLSTRAQGAHPQGLCGDNLSHIISLICGTSGYGGRGSNKRKREAQVETDTESLDHHLKDIILGKREALSYLHKRRAVYGTQGITCECCYNSCTYSELAEYCN